MPRRIEAVTFDLWDTILDDESDEPKRRAQGLRSKPEERRHLVFEALRHHDPVATEVVDTAYDVVDAVFNKVWRDLHVTWPIGQRLAVLLAGLGRRLPAGEMAELVRRHEEMELVVRPDCVDGIREVLEELSKRYKLCVVSDTIFTPGRVLRQLLEGYGLARSFGGFAFSDEVGRSKPHPRMFEAASTALGVPFERMVHVGDREHNDIEGPKALGMRAILFTAVRSAPERDTNADAVCRCHVDLPAIIDSLGA